MSLRLVTAALIAAFFLIAGFAHGQPREPTKESAPAASSHDEQIDRIRERERTGADPNVATGSFGTTGRGSASGAADSAPADRHRDAGNENVSEPTGPASAERRPGTAVGQ